MEAAAALLLMEEEEQQQQQQQQPIVSLCDHLINKKRKKKRKINTVSVQLPEHIIHNEILTRLPPKYILRFRLVCKSWNSLFSTSAFVNSHLTRQHRHCGVQEDLLIVKEITHGEGIFIFSHTRIINVRSVPCVCDALIGSINGLVCMSALTGYEFCLWNPAIAYLKIFDMPSSEYHPKEHACNHYLAGFCWDHVRNDYKVLLFCFNSPNSAPTQLLIYSTNDATWDKLGIPGHIKLPLGRLVKNTSILISSPSTIVKGIPYWSYPKYLPGLGKKNKYKKLKIISTFKFVPENNEFKLLPDLDSLSICGKEFDFVNIKDRLIGIAYKIDSEDNSVDMYSLDDEDSGIGVWSKMCTIGPIDIPSGGWLRLHCFRNGGEILIGSRGPISFYDRKRKQTKVLIKSGYYGTKKFDLCYSYTPSLVCVKGMESMQEFLVKCEVENYRYRNYETYCAYDGKSSPRAMDLARLKRAQV